jgi:hypothetical protein
MGRAAELGRNLWDLMNEETVELLFAIQAIWKPVYEVGENAEGDEAREEEVRAIFGRRQYVWWPKLREALGFEIIDDGQYSVCVRAHKEVVQLVGSES